MRILLITQSAKVRRTWGITKVVLDASDALKQAGAHCDIFPPEDIDPNAYEDRLRSYLETTRGKYDVIEIPDTLPYAIRPRNYARLVVARSVLLPLHLKTIRYTTCPTTLKSRIRSIFFNHWIQRNERQRIDNQLEVVRTRLREAHIINVANSKDREVLIEEGFSNDHILVLPYGLQQSRWEQLTSIDRSNHIPQAPRLVFVGTFDFRKGCLDIVKVFQRFRGHHSQATLRLLGTRGLMTSESQVLRFFPKQLRSQVEVVESFEESQLPGLLEPCHLGLFPSYWEGFGISVVEQLAAGIPVVAYDAPGPCDILPPKWLVAPGDVEAMTNRLLGLCSKADTIEARKHANNFKWNEIGHRTFEAYQNALAAE